MTMKFYSRLRMVLLSALLLPVLSIRAQVNWKLPPDQSRASAKQQVRTNGFSHCGFTLPQRSSDMQKIQEIEQNLYNRQHTGSATLTAPDTEQYTLPIVFHIIHEGGPENISDSDVHDAVLLLNKAFAEEAPFDPSLGTNINIDFCLGNTAITRHVSMLTDMTMEIDDSTLKQIGFWDPQSYINVWVVNSITSLSMGPAVAGYGMFPSAHGLPVDGIVIEADFIHNDPDDVKVLVHEMGHYLGLYHTFEGGCMNTNCGSNGDHICDTPPDNSIAPLLCTNSVNTCHTDEDDPSANNPFRSVSLGGLGDQPDMHQNYMDYGYQSCQHAFTDGQRTRMRNSLRDIRTSLITSPGNCTVCANPITAVLNLPAALPAGVPFTFTITTTGGTVAQILWIVDGQVQYGNSFSGTISEEKNVLVQVYIIGTGAGCATILNDTVFFNCSVPHPSFTVSPAGIVNPGQTLTLSTPNLGYTYTWLEDGVAIGTGTPFNYVANGTYGRLITVKADNGTCQSVSEPQQVVPGNCSSSKENNVWYFGMGGGIDFNANPPQPILGKIYTEEGCAVICDANGNAMFHSDGVKVGNSVTGAMLLNGDSLKGHASTTQSALFVPQPASNQYVYLFTVGVQAGDFDGNGGIYYSIIDKQGDGGQGAVTVKNQLMVSPVPEKVTAVKNLYNNGIWIIAHLWDSDAFYAWQLLSSGLTSPVVSHTGIVHTSTGYSGELAIGELKSSPSGRKLAIANQGLSIVQVFDFDNATGVISNPITLHDVNLTERAYGLAFSPNERFLYVSGIRNLLSRFDLDAGNEAAIQASGTVISSGTGNGGSIQLAPNGKIYSSRRGSYNLDVISNPNALNVANCGFSANAFPLAPGASCFYGLPNPVQSALATVAPAIDGPDRICLNGSAVTGHYSFNTIGLATYSWIHHGPNAITVLNDTIADILFSTPGTDTLIAFRNAMCGDSYDTLFITSNGPVETLDLGPDRIVCKGTTVLVEAGTGFYQYFWSNGNPPFHMIGVNDSGMVSVEVITQSGCVLRDTMQVDYYGVPLDLGEDTSICSSENLTLSAPAGMNSYLWSTSATTTSITVNDSGIYAVTVSKYGCLFRDTILVRRDVPSSVFASDSLYFCVPDHGLPVPSGFDAYMWTYPTGMQTDSLVIEPIAEGYYVLDYTNRCGSGRDSIYYFKPRIVATDSIISCADTVRLIAYEDNLQVGTNLSTPQYSIHGDTMDVYGSGLYLLVSYYPDVNSNCLILQQVNVFVDTMFTPPSMSVDLGPDTSFCAGHILPLDAGPGFDSYHWSTGITESSTTAYGFGTYYVDAHYCGYTFSDTIHISQNNALGLDLGPDQSICPGQTITLNAGPGFDFYEWNNSSHNQQLQVTVPGTYFVTVSSGSCMAGDTILVSDPGNCPVSLAETVAAGCMITLSPNPGSDHVELSSFCTPGKLRASVYSSDGKTIAENINGNLKEINTFLNSLIPKLDAAVYTLRIQSDDGSQNFRWILLR
jgi:hypothetical protein